MNTTLENLPAAIKENRLRNLAKDIIKYQKFKTSAFINKIDNAGYTKNSLAAMISCGIVYLKTGTKNSSTNSQLYNFIDEYKTKTEILTPLINEQREIQRRNIAKKTSVQKVLNQISNKAKEDSKYQLAVKVGDSIKLANNTEYANAFLDGMKFLGKMDAKLVKVRIEEID